MAQWKSASNYFLSRSREIQQYLFSNWSEKPDVIGSNPILPTFDKALSPNRLRHSTLTAAFTGSSPVGAAIKRGIK